MDIEIVDQPVRFRLHGFSATVPDNAYGPVGLRLMNDMWRVVKEAGLKNTGINHWVYFDNDRMFVGVDTPDAGQPIPQPLETCEFVLPRYARHRHVGPYQTLPQKWRALKTELAARGEPITLPSLEVYGHACQGTDESQAETTILLGLQPQGV